MSQNIFDNEVFFNKYQELRHNPYNYNTLVEQPAIKSLLPKLQNKVVLDLGCGYGKNCYEFIDRGAKYVVGIDISKKMLDIAKRENINELIEYLHMDMDQISLLNKKFDLVFSSLAMHYVKNFKKLIIDIRELLNPGGILLFSQEHPYTTAPKGGPKWTKDEAGKKIYYNLSDYMHSGERRYRWFVDDVEKYHRPISEIVNTIISQGYIINKIIEPVPDKYALEKRPDYIAEFDKTSSIIIKSTRI